MSIGFEFPITLGKGLLLPPQELVLGSDLLQGAVKTNTVVVRNALWRGVTMCHFANANVGPELLRNELWTVVADNLWCHIGKLLTGSLHNRLLVAPLRNSRT